MIELRDIMTITFKCNIICYIILSFVLTNVLHYYNIVKKDFWKTKINFYQIQIYGPT